MNKKIYSKILNIVAVSFVLFNIFFVIICGCYYLKSVNDINFLKDIHTDLYNLHAGYLLIGMGIWLLIWGMQLKLSMNFTKIMKRIKKLEEKIGGKKYE